MVGKMIPGFLARPFLGAAVGFLVYLAVVRGFWIVISPNSGSEFRPFGLAFLSLFGGLFAKTFLKKLNGVFDTIFSSQYPAKYDQKSPRLLPSQEGLQ